MLYLYLAATIAGGGLVALSALTGGDVDTDVDADVDLDADVDADVDADADPDADGESDSHADLSGALGLWFPFTQLRFWTFFFGFGGTTGLLLSLFGAGSPLLIASLAGVVGYTSGAANAALVGWLKKGKVTSALEAGDFAGATAQVVLPLVGSAPGQVRLSLKGRALVRTARTDDDGAIATGRDVFVLGIDDEGVLVVTRKDPLQLEAA
jgi:hypothetical protein